MGLPIYSSAYSRMDSFTVFPLSFFHSSKWDGFKSDTNCSENIGFMKYSWWIPGENRRIAINLGKNLHLNGSQIYVHPYSQKTLVLFVFSIRSLHTLSLSHLRPQLPALRHACLFARGKVWGLVTSRREVWKEWGHSRVLCQYFHILIVKCVNILANIISEKC